MMSFQLSTVTVVSHLGGIVDRVGGPYKPKQ